MQAFDIEPQPVDRLVGSYFRRHRRMHSRQRRLAADCVFGVMRWRRRLEGYLVMAGVRKPTPAQLIVAYRLWQGHAEPALSEMVPPLDFEEPPAERFPGGPAAFWSFPDFLYDMLVSDYGVDGAARIARALNQPAPTTIRVNTLKSSRDELAMLLRGEGIDARPTSNSPYGLVLPARATFSSLDSYREGLFEVQDEASQLAAMLVRARGGETVIDACAGAGGKTLALAAIMGDRGIIVATDRDGFKLKELRRRAKRGGATCIDVRSTEQLQLLSSLRGHCDAVIIDAPCSGTGTLRRNPDLKWRLDPGQLQHFPRLQMSLLDEYASWLKARGRLVYITCSILRRENEGVVRRFMERAAFELATCAWMRAAGLTDVRLLSPEGMFKTVPSDESAMDGFFGCVLIKKSRYEIRSP